MATFLSPALNIVQSCCGEGLGKVFHKNDNEDQQQAAPAAASKPTAAKPSMGKKIGGFTDKQVKYEDVAWSKLPLSARKAAKIIGFEEASWDGKEWLPVDDKHWADLTDEEKKACETLGWDQPSWDDKYEGTAWADLPTHVQKAAEKLGWDQEKWDEDWDTEAWGKGWEEFSKEEQRCLHVMGYYQATWD